jgi:hypothetical protein
VPAADIVQHQGKGSRAWIRQAQSDSPSGLGSELKQDAQKLGSVAGDRLTQEADSRKGVIASQARSVSGALEKAADELGGQDTPDWLRSSLQQGAQTLQRLADSVERKDPRQLLNDMNDLGRQHPGAFLGACAVAGFAMARVFKAGAAGAVGTQGTSGGYGSSYGSASYGGSGQGGSGYTGAGYAASSYGSAGSAETGYGQSEDTGLSDALGDYAPTPAETADPYGSASGTSSGSSFGADKSPYADSGSPGGQIPATTYTGGSV